MQELKKQTAQRIVSALRQNRQHPWCRKMLTRLRLPPTVHSDSRYRVWQRRFYPFNVYSEKKRLEKLNDLHGNPVQRGLVRGSSICSSLATDHSPLLLLALVKF